jgi:hypothetical protein
MMLLKSTHKRTASYVHCFEYSTPATVNPLSLQNCWQTSTVIEFDSVYAPVRARLSLESVTQPTLFHLGPVVP